MAGGAAAAAAGMGLLARPLPAGAAVATLKLGKKNRSGKSTSLAGKQGPVLQVTSSSDTGAALSGQALAESGETIGVMGVSASPEGVGGLFAAAAAGGTALDAQVGPDGGVSLRTNGRLRILERSGVASIAAGNVILFPVNGGIDEDSIVLATLQDHRPGVHVESAEIASAERGLVRVTLSSEVSEATRVGWLVLG